MTLSPLTFAHPRQDNNGIRDETFDKSVYKIACKFYFNWYCSIIIMLMKTVIVTMNNLSSYFTRKKIN